MTLSEIKDWQDLRVGDTVIQRDETIIYTVDAIDLKCSTDSHISIRGTWVRDDGLIVNFQKVEIDKKEPLLLEDLIHERKSKLVSEYIEELEEKVHRLTKDKDAMNEIISKLLESYKYNTKYEHMDLLLVKQAEKFLEENK